MLVAASSYVTDIVPPHRRAEGMSYWGMSTIFAVSMAPAIGLWVFERGGWRVLCVEAAGLSMLMFCGGRLRLVSLLEASAVTARILRHLGLPSEVPAARPARAPPLASGADFW